MIRWDEFDSPFGAAKAKAVGQFASARLPVFGLLFLGKLQKTVVVLLKLLVLLGNDRIVSPIRRTTLGATSATTSATAAAATTFAALCDG